MHLVNNKRPSDCGSQRGKLANSSCLFKLTSYNKEQKRIQECAWGIPNTFIQAASKDQIYRHE